MINRLFAILLFSLSLLLTRNTHAQEASSLEPAIDQAEASYRYQFDLYRQDHHEYQVAKSEWQKSATLKGEQEALVAAKLVATSRAEVQKSYTHWIRLKLLNLVSVYPDAQPVTDKLSEQIEWYSKHQAQVASTDSVVTFDEVMGDYFTRKPSRDKLYAAAQIHLKLAQLSSFQHIARSLYEPILTVLQNKQDQPEVKQGLIHISKLGEEINTQLVKTQSMIGPLESEDLRVQQVFRKTNEALEIIRFKQIELLNLMSELDQRYVKN